MFVVKTDFPVACDSPDHLRPLGTRIDNNTNVKLIEEMESFFPGRKIFSLDLGCSGGQFVVDQFKRGHRALGIEGSDYSITHKRANWPEFHGKLLFTADLTKPFEIFAEGKPARFDVITAWEVLEHLKPEDLQGVLTRIEALLDDDGIFFGSIATVECVFEGVRLHQSVFPRMTWFQEILAEHFSVVPYPFKNAVNELWEKLGESFFFMCRKKKVRKLNLGCGGNRLPAWENHDAEVDISKPLPFADSSFNFILAEHVLEHIHVHDGYRFFEEAYRILKPGGVLRLCVPGVDRIFREYSDEYGRFIESAGFGHATRKGAVEAILFNHGHQSTWTRELLSLLLQAAGFAPEDAEPRKSRHAELRDVDGHWKVIGEAHNRLETIVMEAVKPGLMDLIETAERKSEKKKQVAIGLIEHMGDIVACEPVARHIRARYPDAEITWAVKEAYRELVDTNPHIDRTLSINCLSDWIRITESNLFDHVIDLHVNRRVCTVWGTVLQKKTGDPDVDVEKYFNYGSLLEAFCRGAGLPPLQEGPRVYIPDSAKQKVDNLVLPTAFITMHGISNETCKDWPANKWMQFVRSFCGITGVPVVEVGSKSICGPLSEDREIQYINLCGKLTILETAEVIRRSSLFVGIDSGPGHLANAVGTHGVILLGAYRIFSRYLPYSGDYANGKKAELLYSEKGPAANLPVEKVLHAVLKHFPGVRRKKEVMTKTQESVSTGRFRTAPDRESAPKLIAIYLPQFHPIPENDRWWGKGFTEWTNVAKATPLFNGHHQPHVPAELGFYDLRLPEVRKAQADLAREHGIHGFCYYHYWFNGKLLLERPIQDVLKSGEPDFPFCLCWANENWTRRWDGGDHEVLMEQKYSEQDDRDHIRYLAEYFRDPRYIRVDGKPLFLVYRANRMPDPSKTTRIWREEARRLGIGELYLCRVESFPDEHTDPAASGFDAAVEFQPDWTQVGPPVHHLADKDCRIYRYGDVAQRMMNKAAPPYKRFPCVTPRWDNSPRWKRGATIFVDSTPELYERWLRATLETFKPASPEENFVFLNAWNEWGEGNHLEPDARFGRGYLEATRRALDAVRRSEQDTAAEAHAGILRTLIAAGKRAEAVPALERLVESWPDYAPAHNDLGVLFYESGNGDKALACYEKAVTLAPENPMFRKNLADFYFVTEGRVEEALELYRKVLAQRPDDVETLIALGQLCARIERIDDSICFFRRVLELDSHNSEVRELYDKLLLLKKSLDEPPMANTDDHLQPDKQMHDYVCTIQAGQEKAGVTGTLHLNVLLTNHHLTDFTGSEVFTFTIADFLKKKGHRVTVLSKYVDNSLRRYFNRIGVTVVQDIATLIGESFDVAHIHHNVMAMEVRRHFKDLPLVFLSHGVIPFLEQNPPVDIGVSRYLAVSEEVHENLIQHGVDSNRLEIFRNIVDSDKFSPRAALSAHPARALILSNKLDPATERTIREACSRLDIVATFAGMRFGVAHQDYLPEMINQADIVFTLGRGVIETMMCGRVPIVLDHRGGDGMVTPDNVEHLMKRNFSGRTHRRMYNTDELMREIARYEPSFGDSLRRMALDRFDADKNIGRLIDVYKEAMSLDIPHLEESTCNQIDAFLATVDTTRHFSQIEASRAIRSTVETNPEKPVADKVDTFLSERLKKLRTQPGEFTKGLDTTPLSDQTYDILIPIFNAFEHLQRCIDSVIRHTHGNHAIYLLDDCSTDSRVLPLLESFEKADPRVRLIESSINRGFVHNVNRGFELSENDVVILNSDTEVTEGWLARMHRCLHSHPDIGIVCPLSNNATILSVPVMNKCNSLPEGMSPNDFAALVAKVSRADYPEIPTGVGFCMLISRDTLKRTGFFDPAFGLGYGEENDLCMKARAAGKKIVCCDDAYVHHYGEASFCRIDRIDDKRKLNEMLLSKKWPNYSKEIYTFCCVNPLREVQERILATIKDYESPVLPEVLHVMHNFDAPGGTELHTRNIIDGLAEQLRSTVIYPASLPDQWVDLAAKEVNGYLRVLKLRKESIAVNDSFLELYGDLTNPFVETVFSNILRGGRYSIVHFQHLGGWSSLLLPLIAKDQGCKVVISLHDYYLLCPEYNLILPNLRRCGKYIPDGEDSECLYCLGTKRKYHGAGKPSLLQDYLDHRKLIVKRVFEAADMLIAPSNFVRDRFIQAYQEEVKDKIVTVPHGIEHLDKSKRSKRGHALRVGFLGNASDRKGVFTLLQAARILKGKPIQFEIFGGAPPSLTKMASELGIIQHGFYNRSDLPRLLAKTHLVMIPSVWDETFCLTASESQMMGIPVIASDCGAISERIVDGKTGFLVTPGDAKALAARLLEILDNPSLLEEVTANLRDHHIKTMRENIEDYARIYDRLLGIPARHDSEVHPHPMPIPSGRNLTSIVILTFNELEYTKRCVESIRRHTPEPYEIIFVDNGSKDGTIKWLRELVKQNSHVKLIENGRNLGFAKGCNQGIEAAAGEFILLLNNDTVVTEGWLAGMLECLHRMPDAGIVGPMTNQISGIQKVETVDYDSIEGLDDYARTFRQKNRHRCIKARRVVGFCMLFRKDLVDKIGPLDESFGTGNFEDDDFCVRAALAGYRNVIAGDVFIHHFGSRSFIGNRIDYGTALAGNRKIYTDKWQAFERKVEEGGKIRSLVARERAQEQFLRGDVQGAVDLWLAAIRHLPGDHRAYHEMADGLIRAKRFRDALDVLNEVPAGPASAERLVLEGRCREGLDELDAAEKMAVEALSARADSPSALNLRGVVAFRRGAAGEARSFFGKASEADPSWGEPVTNLGVLTWADGRHGEAFNLLEKGFILTPCDSDLAERYHAAASSLGLQARAEKAFREARSLYPASRTIAFLLIDLLIAQEKHAEAMAEIEAAMAAFEVDGGLIDAALEVRRRLGPMAIGDKTPGPTLSLCMIVRNEQSNLVRCLSSVKAAVDEIVVVDTGSTDRTKDLAAVFGARVFDFAWTDDFSSARNESLARAKGDWILVLDADETLSPADHRKLRELIRKSPKRTGGYDLATRNYVIEANTAGWTANDGSYPGEEAGTGWYANRKVRLFRNDPRIRFSGAVHELVEASMLEAGMKIAACDIPVHHTGKLDRARVTEKGERYFELGMKKIEETGGTPRAVLELAVQAGELGRWDDAVDLWRRFLGGNPGGEAVRAYVNLINACLNADRFDEALAEARKAEMLANGTRELLLNCAAAEFFAGDLRKAAATAQRLLRKHPDYPPALGLLAMSFALTGQEERSLECMQRLQERGLDTRAQLLPAVAKLRIAEKDEQADRLQELIGRHTSQAEGRPGPAPGRQPGERCSPTA